MVRFDYRREHYIDIVGNANQQSLTDHIHGTVYIDVEDFRLNKQIGEIYKKADKEIFALILGQKRI